MPDPSTLRHYEQIVPGAADRILKMAEANTTERAEVDRNLANAEIVSARTGLWFAFFLSVGALISAVVFFAVGNNVAGGLLLSPPVVMLIKSMIERGSSSE
jgi:uncharacterized membrane protein